MEIGHFLQGSYRWFLWKEERNRDLKQNEGPGGLYITCQLSGRERENDATSEGYRGQPGVS